VKLGALRGMPDSLVPRNVRFNPKLKTFGTAWWLSMWGHPTMCLGLSCKVINQSIIDLSPFSETA
jgi:hypothetical protein